MKTVLCTLVVLLGPFLASAALATETPRLEDENARISYSVGFQVGGDFKRQGVALSHEALLRGVEDALAAANPPLLSAEEMRTTLVELKRRVVADQEREKKAAVERYRGEGQEFLAANAKQAGVVTRTSGLQYKVLRAGNGRHPAAADSVTVQYRGTLIDGSEFDSSFRQGKAATLPLSGAIPGWKEALPLMQEGDKWQLFLPANLAFGERGPLADRTVIYEVELLAVEPGP